MYATEDGDSELKTVINRDRKTRLAKVLISLGYTHENSFHEIWKEGQLILLQSMATDGELFEYYAYDSGYYVNSREIKVYPDSVLEDIWMYHEIEQEEHPMCPYINGGMIKDILLKYPKNYYCPKSAT